MDFTFDYVDFTSVKESNNNKNNNNYDLTTTETYRIKRLFKLDPFTDEEIPENLMFKFYHKWDPYTGERSTIDEVGPLCFNALTLYEYYFKNRLNGLWNPPTGVFEGYYGDLVGCGENIEIVSRGLNPQKYLFRLPIIDCYLKQDHNLSVVAMGPLLTNEEINTIDKLINGKKKSPLSLIKKYYDSAITTNIPQIEIENLKNNFPTFDEKELKDKFNRQFVEKLKILQ